jgi:hypothetical protein
MLLSRSRYTHNELQATFGNRATNSRAGACVAPDERTDARPCGSDRAEHLLTPITLSQGSSEPT